MGYQLEGRLLEVCTCNILCPCWVGEDPDGGKCDGVLAWHIDKGKIDGVDVSGHTFAMVARIPGNILKGNWKVAVYLDDKTTPEQQDALTQVFTGKLGGPIADLAGLVGEVMSMEKVPIKFDVNGGKGRLTIGDAVDAELEPFQGATGQATALHDTVFTTIPGSAAYVGKAPKYKADVPRLGLKLALSGHNAIQGTFKFTN
jgi:hypothetical protein